MTLGRSYISDLVSHYLVLDRPWGLLCPRAIHSMTLIFHLLSLLNTCPAHRCLLSLLFLIMSVTAVCFRIQFVLFLYFRVTPTTILSIFLWVVISFSSWVLLSYQPSRSYVMTWSIHWLSAFSLVSLAHFRLAWCFPAYRMHSIRVQFSFSFLVPGHGP